MKQLETQLPEREHKARARPAAVVTLNTALSEELGLPKSPYLTSGLGCEEQRGRGWLKQVGHTLPAPSFPSHLGDYDLKRLTVWKWNQSTRERPQLFLEKEGPFWRKRIFKLRVDCLSLYLQTLDSLPWHGWVCSQASALMKTTTQPVVVDALLSFISSLMLIRSLKGGTLSPTPHSLFTCGNTDVSQ